MLKRIFCTAAVVASVVLNTNAGTPNKPRSPYVGAVIVDAYSGEVLFEDRADSLGSPASTLKLMTLLVIQERITAGKISLDDIVSISKEAFNTGGSQVWLDPKEKVPVEDLLYALMIQSANDAAVALAEHVADSKDGFLDLMNAKAKELGMKNTHFTTVNGLRPDAGKPYNVTTARDMSLLSCELCRYPEVFKYTSAVYRKFTSPQRKDHVDMRTHNPFLKKNVEGCDGFKTGFTSTAGWSIVVTCKRNGRRINIIVLGSSDRLLRDAQAAKLLEKGFALIEGKGLSDDGKSAPAPRKFTPPPPPPPPFIQR